jgi:hypothetical protein
VHFQFLENSWLWTVGVQVYELTGSYTLLAFCTSQYCQNHWFPELSPPMNVMLFDVNHGVHAARASRAVAVRVSSIASATARAWATRQGIGRRMELLLGPAGSAEGARIVAA